MRVNRPTRKSTKHFEAENVWFLESLSWCDLGHRTLKPKTIDLSCCLQWNTTSIMRLDNYISLNVAKTVFMIIGFCQRLATLDNHEINVTVSSN